MAADEAKNLNSQKNFEKFGFALVSFLEDDKNLEKQKKNKKKTKCQTPWTTLPRAGQT